MLTRSASRKKAESPVKSVKKNEVAVPDNVLEHKVMMPRVSVPQNTENVTSPVVQMNFHELPERNGSGEHVEEGSNNTVNCPMIRINMSPNYSKIENESCGSHCSCVSFKLKPRGSLFSRDMNDEKVGSLKFSPGSMSTARKKDKTCQEFKLSRKGTGSEINDPEDSHSGLMMLGDTTTDEESDTSQELSLYKGVVVNGGYRPSEFKKEPFVQLKQLTSREIRKWSNFSSSVTNVGCCFNSSRNFPDSKVQVEEREQFLGVKIPSEVVCNQHGMEKEGVSRNENIVGGLNLSGDAGQLCEKDSSPDIGINRKPRRELYLRRIFGDFRGEFNEMSDGGFSEDEWLRKCIDDQDSITTEEFYKEGSEEDVTSVNDEGDQALEAEGNFDLNEERGGFYWNPEYRETILEERSADKRTRDVKLRMDVDGGKNATKHGRPSLKRRKNKSVSLGVRQEGEEKLNRTVMGDVAIEEGRLQYRHRETLLSIQLDCIKQEILARNVEVGSSSAQKKSKQSRKTEKTPTDNVTCSRTRRSLRVSKESRTPTLTQQSVDEVTTTPRSSRSGSLRGSLRREVAETMMRREREVSPSRGSRPKTRTKPKKVNDRDEEGAEVITEGKSTRRSVKPKVEDNEKIKDNEFDAVSSPLKKKKQAAERLRAEEELLEEKEMKEKDVAAKLSQSPKKRPVTPALEAGSVVADTPVLTTLRKITKRTMADRQNLIEESPNAEVPSSPAHETKSLKKRDGSGTGETAEASEASPKVQETNSPKKQETEEVEGSASELVEEKTPTRRKRRTHVKEPEEVDLGVAESPKLLSSRSPEKKFDIELKSIVETMSTKRQKTKRRGKRDSKEREPGEMVDICHSERETTQNADVSLLPRGSNQVEMTSPKRQKSVSLVKRQRHEVRSEESVSEEHMRLVSPQKQNLTDGATEKQDVEIFCVDIDSEGTELPSAKVRERSSPKAMQESGYGDGLEVTPTKRRERRTPKKAQRESVVDVSAVSSPKGRKSDTPSKTLPEVVVSEFEDAETGATPVREKSKTPRKRHKEQHENDSDLEITVTASAKRRRSKSPQKNLEEMDELATPSSDDHKRRKAVGDEVEKVGEAEEADFDVKATVASSPKRHGSNSPQKNPAETNESASPRIPELREKDASQFSRSTQSKWKKPENVPEDGDVSLPRLEEDFLSSIPSRKTSVEVKNQGKSREERIREKNDRKQKKLLKQLMNDDGYIPLNAGGATDFSVVGLDKFNTCTRHPSFDLKRSLLYGSRVKRIPYSSLQGYNMKVESRKMRF